MTLQRSAQRCDEQLDDHAGRPDENPLPFAGKRPGGGGVHVGRRHQHQKHQAHFVAFAAKPPAGKRVAALVQKLDDHERRVQPEDVFEVVLEVERGSGGGFQFRPSRQHHRQRESHHHQPDDRPHLAEQLPGHGHPSAKELIRIPKPNAREQHVHQPVLHLLLHDLFVPAQKDHGVGGDVGLKQIGRVKLAEHLDDFGLGGASSASWPPTRSHASSTVRRPSRRPTKR